MDVRLTGHVRDLGGGRWELVANLPRRPGDVRGRRKSQRIRAKGVKRATGALGDWLAVLEQHDCADPGLVTLGEVLRRWLEHAPANAGEKTMERYRELVEKHLIPGLGEWRVCELSDTQLYLYYQLKLKSGRLDGRGGLSPQTVGHLHAVIRAALTYAQERGLVRENVARQVKHPPKPEPRKRPVWGAVQVARAVAAAERSQIRVPLALAGWAGLRRGEICALRWSDLDLNGKALAVRNSVSQTGRELHWGPPKTAKARRVVPLPAQLVDLLAGHKRVQDEMQLASGAAWNERGLVCCRADGEPMFPDTLSSQWAQFVRQHKLEPRLEFHGLRRSFLSRLHEAGAPDALVMEWAGHADMRTTHSHYLVTFDETALAVCRAQEDAISAAMLELDSAKVCQRRASVVVSLAERRARRKG
jgi:integrase